jgi:hypothetical protein
MLGNYGNAYELAQVQPYQPDRIIMFGDTVTLESNRRSQTVKYLDGRWQCLYANHAHNAVWQRPCEHVMILERLPLEKLRARCRMHPIVIVPGGVTD